MDGPNPQKSSQPSHGASFSTLDGLFFLLRTCFPSLWHQHFALPLKNHGDDSSHRHSWDGYVTSGLGPGPKSIQRALDPEKVLRQAGKRTSPFWGGWAVGLWLGAASWTSCHLSGAWLIQKPKRGTANIGKSENPLKLGPETPETKLTIPFILNSVRGLLTTCNQKNCH